MLGIGDFVKVNTRKVRTSPNQIFYNGIKYSLEKSTGYYVCTTGSRRRLHDVMWETETGMKIPAGCVVHHLDWNKNNNKINNLVCVTIEEHNKIHNIIGGEEGKRFGYELKERENLRL